jgi:ATP-binding cassette, subfamily C (CFTR/MRP), member 1
VTLLVVVQSMLLINILSSNPRYGIGVASAITSFIACIGLYPLLYLEHTRTIKPSDLAAIYILLSLVCDFADLAANDLKFKRWILAPTITNLCVKVFLLVAESRGKNEILQDPYGQHPPEQLAGILNIVFSWWINPILAQGSRRILTLDDLPQIDHNLSSKLLRRDALQEWDQRGTL